MTYSNKHLSEHPISPDQKPAARGCCLTVFVTAFAAVTAALVSAIGLLPAW